MATAEIGADVIIVGAGAAGCVIARRLHDAGASVLLLEAGGEATDARIVDPTRSPELVGSEYDWGLRTVPQRNLGGRILQWPRGRALGGSTAINGLVWVRGCPADYDHWAYAGNPGWSYRELLEIFRRIENFDQGASEYRGAGGPVSVTSRFERGAIHQAVLGGLHELGVPFNDDHNGAEIMGAGWCQYNIRNGSRVSAADAYLTPIADSARLELIPYALVTRVLLERGRCVGVEWYADGHVRRARAAAEVVLAAGVIGSPQLLLLSGIGPADELAAIEIPVVVDLPGVGRNLQDHVHVPLLYTTERAIDPPVGVPAYQAHAFIKTDPSLFTPDIQAPSIAALASYPGLGCDNTNGFTIAPTTLRAASRGRLWLASDDPSALPLIDPGTFEGPGDLASLVRGIRFLRRLGDTAALREWAPREIHPGPGSTDDDELEVYARRTAHPAFHPIGSCKMGVDAEAVVDPRLRVYDVECLRVADASIMPTVVSGNTQVAAFVIGERAADLLTSA